MTDVTDALERIEAEIDFQESGPDPRGKFATVRIEDLRTLFAMRNAATPEPQGDETRADRVENALVAAYKQGWTECADSCAEEGMGRLHRDVGKEGAGMYRFVARSIVPDLVAATPEQDGLVGERKRLCEKLENARGNGDPAKYLAGVTVQEAHLLAEYLRSDATQIAELRRERDELMAALEPFANAAEDLDGEPDNCSMWEHHVAMNVTAGDFRRANELLPRTGPCSCGEVAGEDPSCAQHGAETPFGMEYRSRMATQAALTNNGGSHNG